MGSRRVNANQRLRWTDELHQRFVDAVAQLGGRDGAKPKAILGHMGEPAVTLNHVKSHLQKYRLAASVPDSSCSHGRKANRKEAAKRKEPAAKRKEPVKRKEPAAKRKEPATSSFEGKRTRKTVKGKEAVEDTRSNADFVEDLKRRLDLLERILAEDTRSNANLVWEALKLHMDQLLEARRQVNVQLEALKDRLKNMVDELQTDS